MSDTDDIQVDRAGAIVRITIDRLARMNALDLATVTALNREIVDAGADSVHRVVVLTGAGTAFSAGADLGGLGTVHGRDDQATTIMEAVSRLITSVIGAPIPVIARINGPAAGVGVSLGLAADLSYAAEDTYLLLPFLDVGLMPDGGATALVAAAMGRARAARMALLGQRLPAGEAAEAGLITAAVPAAELDRHVDAAAALLANASRRAVELTKHALNAATLPGFDAALQREKAGQRELFGTGEFTESLAALLARRASTRSRSDRQHSGQDPAGVGQEE